MIRANNLASQREKILLANRAYHALEADVYDSCHGEIYNLYAQTRLKNVLRKNLQAFSDVRKSKEAIYALDCACGTGNVGGKLLEYGYKIDALDISPEMLTVFDHKFGDRFKDRFRTIECDIDSFLENGPLRKYDIIVFSSALHHLPDYLSTYLKAVKLLKRPGMIMVFHEPLSGDKKYVKRASTWIRRADRLVWKYWGKITRRKGPSALLSNIDADFVDFHVGRDGVNPDDLIRIAKQEGGKVLDYSPKSENQRHVWSALLDNLLGLCNDNFDLIVLFG